MATKFNPNTTALWDAWQQFIKSNWPCSAEFLRDQIKIDINTARSLQRYARKMLEAPVHNERVEVSSDDANEQTVTSKSTRIKSLDQLLEATATDLTEWEVKTHKVNSWEVGAKASDGTIITETLFQVTANLERRFNPKNLQTVIYDNLYDYDQPTKASTRAALIIPDIQMGFRWEQNYSYLNPMHDRVAMDVVWNVAVDMQPTEILLVGDALDYTAWSKFDTTPDLKQTTQPALNELYWWLVRLRQACPKSKIIWIGGNHEQRKDRKAFAAVEELFYVKRAGSDLGVLSHRELLNLDNMQVKMVEPYGSEYWLWSTIRVHHGIQHETKKIISDLQYHSEIQGHSHRLALNAKTVHGPTGPRDIYSMQPGSLCRRGKYGPPSYQERMDWQQGFGIVYHTDHQPVMQVYPIDHGMSLVNGKVYKGQDCSADIARDIGWRQITSL